MLRTTLSALVAATMLSILAAPAAHATDAMHLLTTVSQGKAEAANEDLDKSAKTVKGAKSNTTSTYDKMHDTYVQNIRG